MVMLRFATDVRIRRSGTNPATAIEGPMFRFWHVPRSGQTVNDDTALGLTSVYRAITLISSKIGGLPIHIYQEAASGTRRRVEPNLFRCIWDRPNREMTKVQMWEMAIGHECIGDAFLFVEQNADRDPLGLWPVEPRRVRVGRTSSGRKVYQIDHESEVGYIDYRDGGEIIHIPNWGKDGLRGINPITVAPAATSLGLSAQEYADRFFAQDSTPGGLLTTDQVITTTQADELAARWEERHGGGANFHRIAVLGSGAKFSAVSVSPEDAELLEERRFQIAEIARLFGVPPHLLADTTGSTSWGTGIEEQTHGFVVYTLQAHINRFENAINDALLRRGETGMYVKFELGELLRGTLLKRYQAYKLADFMTVNEKRQLEDLPPVEGGDIIPTPSTMAPLSEIAEPPEPEPEPVLIPEELTAAAPRRNGHTPPA